MMLSKLESLVVPWCIIIWSVYTGSLLSYFVRLLYSDGLIISFGSGAETMSRKGQHLKTLI
jgi:hypothetical protein